MSDFIYADPPLVEVIAEVFWHVEPLSIIPGAAIDVAFSSLMAVLPNAMEALHFGIVEYVTPPTVPPELLAGKPVVRFRKQPETWPVYQLGPGLFACNAVPPYQGWASFRQALSQGIDCLRAAWPGKYPVLIKKLQLRYIDAFTEKFGYKSDSSFLASSLRLGSGVDESVLKDFSSEGELSRTGIVSQFSPRGLANAVATIGASPGLSSGGAAYIVTFGVEMNSDNEPDSFDPDRLLDLFDAAHHVVKGLFETTVTDELRARFGEKRHLSEDSL